MGQKLKSINLTSFVPFYLQRPNGIW